MLFEQQWVSGKGFAVSEEGNRSEISIHSSHSNCGNPKSYI